MTTETKLKFLNPDMVDTFLKVVPKSSMMTVVFQKKDGSRRRMNCRRGVKAHLQGGESTIKDHENLVGVYENKNDYRCFDKTRVLQLHGGGMTILRKQEDDA